MFFGSKRRKIAHAVLEQIRTDFAYVERLIGPLPPAVAIDQYVFGYLISTIASTTHLISDGKLSAEDKGFVIFHCIKGIFGGNAPSNEQITARTESGRTNPDFMRGVKTADKIMCTLAGILKYENDPEVVAARQEVRTLGKSLDFLDPGANENSKVASHLQARFYQYIVDHHGKS